MNLYLFTEGGGSAGYGHLTRCLSIYEGALERGLKPLIVVNIQGDINNILPSYTYIEKNWFEDFKPVEQHFELDIAIIDSYKVNFSILEKISKTFESTAYIDDTNRITYPQGTIINGSIGAPKLNYAFNADNNYLLGIKYQPIRSEFINIKPIKIHKHIRKVFISFGGTDIRNLTEKCIDYVNDIIPEAETFVLKGGSIDYQSSNKNRIYSNLGVNELLAVISQCDLAIIAGGQMMYEMARQGLPTIAIKVIDNQKTNLIGWEDSGFLTKAIDWTNLSRHTLNEKINELISQEERKKRSQIGYTEMDGKGVFRILDYLLDNI